MRRVVGCRLLLGGRSRLWTASEAVADIRDNSTLLVGGFGLSGTPNTVITALKAKGVSGLTVVSNNCGVDDRGLGLLLEGGQIKRMCSSYVGECKAFATQYSEGDLELEIMPQGTLAERLRAGGAGIPAFFTPASAGTSLARGEFPLLRAGKKSPKAVYPKAKEVRTFDGREYVMEEAIRGDFALVKAWRADTLGNLQYKGTARNFNPMCAAAAKVTIAEVEEVVPAGAIPPSDVHTPGVYVTRVVLAPVVDKFAMIERRVFGERAADVNPARLRMAKRAALEVEDGAFVNLGIGVPMLVPQFVPSGRAFMLQAENGLLGIGKYPERESDMSPDLTNPGKETITMVPGASLFSSADSFAMIRGGHISLTILGGYEASASGDLANWVTGGTLKGPGGAMDLVSSGSRVVVTMEHCIKGKDGKPPRPKILPECTAPLTGRRVIDRLITERAVFDVDKRAADPAATFTLVELAPGETVESVRAVTAAAFKVSPSLCAMRSE